MSSKRQWAISEADNTLIAPSQRWKYGSKCQRLLTAIQTISFGQNFDFSCLPNFIWNISYVLQGDLSTRMNCRAFAKSRSLLIRVFCFFLLLGSVSGHSFGKELSATRPIIIRNFLEIIHIDSEKLTSKLFRSFLVRWLTSESQAHFALMVHSWNLLSG